MRSIAGKLKVNPSDFDEYLVQGGIDPKSAGFQTVMMNLVIAKTAESKKQYPALYEAIFNLKEGEVSDLIEDDTGSSSSGPALYLPEKQLGFDDLIEGLTNTKAAQPIPPRPCWRSSSTSLQSTKYASSRRRRATP
jgi:hypothetical protein